MPVLDIRDDPGLRVLIEKFGSLDAIPAEIAHADISDPDDCDSNDFCLTALVDEKPIHRYLTKTAGDTVLSTIYFLEKGASVLDEETRRDVAEQLSACCNIHGLSAPPELQKEAGVWDTTTNAARRIFGVATGRSAAKAAGEHGKALREVAEAAHKGATLPHSAEAMARMSEKANAEKAIRNLAWGGAAGAVAAPTVKKKYEDVKRWDQMRRYRAAMAAQGYKVASLTEDRPVIAQPQRTCLPGKYPIDTPEQVKRASAYFTKYASRFAPSDRRRYAKAVSTRGVELGVPVSDDVHKYASDQRGVDSRDHLMMRAKYADPARVEKLAASVSSLPMEVAMLIVEEFDKTAGIDRLWDHHIADPVLSVTGMFKFAEAPLWEDRGFLVHLNDLKGFVTSHPLHLHRVFDDKLVEGLTKNTEAVFKSLPDPTKETIAKMVMQYKSGELGV